MKRIFLIFILTGLSFFVSSAVFATTIISPLLELEADPGESLQGVVKIFNETDKDLVLSSSIEPFSAGDELGHPVYLPAEEKDSYLSWFKLDQDSLVLKPKQAAVIPFSLDVPQNAVPGGYYAVIFWQEAGGQIANGNSVGINSKVGTLVFLQINGELEEKAELAEFSIENQANYFWQGPIKFIVRFGNAGNIHLKPSGEIELKDWLGQTIRLPVNQQGRNVLPGSVRKFEVLWGGSASAGGFFENFWQQLKAELGNLFFGKYTAKINLEYGSQPIQLAGGPLVFWVIPLRLIISIVLGIIFLLVFLKINSKVKKLKKSSRNNVSKR